MSRTREFMGTRRGFPLGTGNREEVDVEVNVFPLEVEKLSAPEARVEGELDNVPASPTSERNLASSLSLR